MFKKLLVLAAIFSLASCSSTSKKNSAMSTAKNDFSIEESKVEDSYQAVEDANQAEELNQETEAEVAQQQEEIEVQDRVFFDYDSASLTADAKAILDTQILWLKSDKSINITIEGHCDERGTREYNIALGDKRANASKNYLVANGIDASRIKTISYGKERPIYFGNDEAVISKNRRAVAIVN